MKAVMTKTISLILAAGMILSPAAVMADPVSESESAICSEAEYSAQSLEKEAESVVSMEEAAESTAALSGAESAATETVDSKKEEAEKPESDQGVISQAEVNPDQSRPENSELPSEKQKQPQNDTGSSNDSTVTSTAAPAEKTELGKAVDSKAETTAEEKPENVSRNNEVSEGTTEGANDNDNPVQEKAAPETPEADDSKAAESEKTKTEMPKKVQYGIYPEEIKDIDFSSGRILVGTSDPSVFRKEDLVLSHYGDLYLLSFPDAAGALEAYCYYTGKVDFVDADIEFSAATEQDAGDDGSWMVQDDAISQLTELTEDGTDTVRRKDHVIALIDSGVPEDSHVIERVSVIGDNPGDDNGHGSQMLSVITDWFPDAKVISIKALDSRGKGSTSSIYAGIQYAIERGVSVINLSLCAYSTDENASLVEAVKQANAAGIFVVGAAGNKGRNVRYYTPGNIREAVIVGSCDQDGQRLDSSNYGDTVDYNVCSSSTSEAAAIMSAYLASHMRDDGSVLMDTNHNGLIFTTDYVKPADDPKPQESEPGDPDPTESTPTESGQTGTDPAESTPAESDPAESDPADTDPDTTDPVNDETDPVETDPEILEGPGYPYGTILGDKDEGDESTWATGEVQDEEDGEFSAAAELSVSSNTSWTAYFTENPEGSRERTENLHQMGSTRIYCMDGGLHFQAGTAEKTTMSAAGWTEARTKKAALAWYYILNISTVDITKKQKQQIFQTLLWNLKSGELSKYVYTTDPPKKTYNSVVNAFDTWYSSNKNYYDYTATFYKTKGTTGNQPLATFSVSPKIYMYLKKTSSTTATNNNSNYSLKGAVYGVYSDSACTKQVTTLTTKENGESQLVEISSAGTYYVKEKTASTGFLLDTMVHSVKVTASNSHDKPATVSVTEIPKTYLYLKKTSDSTQSIAGAVYGVYSDSACTKSVGTLTTTANGDSNTIQVAIGTYYVKETKAPAGYGLDTTTHTVSVTASNVAGNPAKVTSAEPSDAYVYLKKESSNPSASSNTALYSLSDAVYGVYSDAACTKQVTTLTTKADGNSDSAKVAIGTYYAKEKTAPKGFKLNTTVITVSVTAANNASNPAVIRASDEPIPSEPPSAATTAAFAGGAKYVDASKTRSTTVTDTLTYKGFMPNTAYTVSGTLYDAHTQQSTGITATVNFTTGNADSGKLTCSGSVTVTFSIPDVSQYVNHTLVVTEIVKQGSTEIARHFNLSDKAQTVYIVDTGKKEVSQVSNSIGEVHTWTVTNIIPDGISGNEANAKYEIKDTIDSRLDYAGNLKVSAKKKDGTAVALTSGTDYTLSQPAVGNAGGSWTVAMTTTGLTKLGTAPWGTTVVTFDTKINATAQAATDIPNKSTLDFNNLSFVTNEVYVYTGDVEIRKVDAATGNPLQGAVFGLYTDAACSNAFMRDGSPYTATSGSDGYAKFHGLKDGTYWIRELKTMRGHELLKDPFQVTVEEGKCTAESITVSNQAKIVLQTGGAGRNGIYLACIVSAMIVAMLVAVLAALRKKNSTM